jgi:uncharacterized protein (TIGR04255 family)
MNAPRRYANPPIEEALCEFRFKPKGEWDFMTPHKMREELAESYRGKPRQQTTVEARIQQQEGGAAKVMLQQHAPRIQLITNSGTRIVSVGPNILSVHMLRPYHDTSAPENGGWEEFRRRIEQALETYWRIAEPIGVYRVGVRYINKIVLTAAAPGAERPDPRDYLLCSPVSVRNLPERMTSFFNRVEYAYDDHVRLVLTCGSAEEESPERTAWILDIDVIWQREEPIEREAAIEKAEALRDRERVVFEAVITDKARRLFDE